MFTAIYILSYFLAVYESMIVTLKCVHRWKRDIKRLLNVLPLVVSLSLCAGISGRSNIMGAYLPWLKMFFWATHFEDLCDHEYCSPHFRACQPHFVTEKILRAKHIFSRGHFCHASVYFSRVSGVLLYLVYTGINKCIQESGARAFIVAEMGWFYFLKIPRKIFSESVKPQQHDEDSSKKCFK